MAVLAVVDPLRARCPATGTEGRCKAASLGHFRGLSSFHVDDRPPVRATGEERERFRTTTRRREGSVTGDDTSPSTTTSPSTRPRWMWTHIVIHYP
jgi:hypothetical protein